MTLNQEDTIEFIAYNPEHLNEIDFTNFKKSVYKRSEKVLSWTEIAHFSEVII